MLTLLYMKPNNKKPNNNKYSLDYIECIFCCKSINLSNCNNHIKGKLCKEFQTHDKNYNENYINFRKKINQIKEQIKNEK
jgi:hypothetical protein